MSNTPEDLESRIRTNNKLIGEAADYIMELYQAIEEMRDENKVYHEQLLKKRLQ